MTFSFTMIFSISYIAFVILNASPIDLGLVAQGFLDKAPSLAILIGVIYYMLKAQKENKTFYEGLLKQAQEEYKILREEDKKEASTEKQELLAAFEKVEEREKETIRLHQERIETLTESHNNTVKAILEAEDKKNSKQHALTERLLDTVKEKDNELISSYQLNIASSEKVGDLMKQFGERQAEQTGKIVSLLTSKLEQADKKTEHIIQLLKR